MILVVIVAAAVAFYLFRRGKSDSGPKGTVVRLENPQRGDLTEYVNAPGEIEPLTRVAISSRVVARILELPFEEGASVTKGDPTGNPPVPASVLVKLDSKDLEAALGSAKARRAAQAAQIDSALARIESQRAQMASSKASLAKAELDLKRMKDLVATKDASQSELDAAQTRFEELSGQYAAAEHTLASSQLDLKVMQHNLDAADADIARASDTLSYTVISSPIDGVVTRRNAKVGELVMTGTMNNPGTVILEVADLSKMLLVAQIDESRIGKVQTGQTAAIRIQAYPDETFSGVVNSIALTYDYGLGAAKYYKTKILFDPGQRRIYSGLTADVDIQTRTHKDVLMVPNQAVLGRPMEDLPLSIRENNPCVDPKKTIATVVYRFIDGKAVVTPVTIGASDDTHTIVTARVSESDCVVVGNSKVLESIKHDQTVQDEREVEEKKKEEERKKEEAKAKKEAKGKESGKTQSTDSNVK